LARALRALLVPRVRRARPVPLALMALLAPKGLPAPLALTALPALLALTEPQAAKARPVLTAPLDPRGLLALLRFQLMRVTLQGLELMALFIHQRLPVLSLRSAMITTSLNRLRRAYKA